MFKKVLLGLFAAAIFAAFLRVGLREKTETQSRPQASAAKASDSSGVRGAGWMAAKKILPGAIKFPESAEYPFETVAQEKLADGNWLVTGSVIAKNALGVKDAIQYQVIIQEAGDRLNALKVSLDGNAIIDLTAKH